MELQEITSSCIDAVGFNEEDQEIMVLWKSSNTVYSYPDCNKELFDRLLASDSIGKFVNKHLKTGVPI